MADIVLSYARQDRAWASRLAGALSERGWTLFWDPHIPTGTYFDRVIERELKAARCVFVLWSGHSVESDWVRAEAREGKRRGILHRARIEDVQIPLEFNAVQTSRLTEWQPGTPHPEFDRFLTDIATTVSPSIEVESLATKSVSTSRQERDAHERFFETIAQLDHTKPLAVRLGVIAGSAPRGRPRRHPRLP